MAQTTPLAAGTTAANSTDLIVTTPVQVSLYSGESNLRFERNKINILVKDPGGNYIQWTQKQTARGKRFPAYLDNVQRNLLITEPGTYRFRREACTLSVGVYADSQA